MYQPVSIVYSDKQVHLEGSVLTARIKLLNAAATLAVSEGITALSVDRVVREAGVSKGTFFYHFAKKEEMVRGLLDHVAALHMAEVEATVASGIRFTDALIDMICREVQGNGTLVHVLVAAVILDPTLRATLTARSDAWRQRMIEEDGVKSEQAELLRLALDGLMIAMVLYEREECDDQRERAIKAIRSLALETKH